ncbi:hypothetical protein CES86_1780 [Brucella lupini]|uniref:Uncharacterized protein n=1 Tax=Brucella lupini TaxID=255457 RepID=A0A256GTE1_9HYPH|nr:hypothetical protein CES86_1780 [Brucella lupini]
MCFRRAGNALPVASFCVSRMYEQRFYLCSICLEYKRIRLRPEN